MTLQVVGYGRYEESPTTGIVFNPQVQSRDVRGPRSRDLPLDACWTVLVAGACHPGSYSSCHSGRLSNASHLKGADRDVVWVEVVLSRKIGSPKQGSSHLGGSANLNQQHFFPHHGITSSHQSSPSNIIEALWFLEVLSLAPIKQFAEQRQAAVWSIPATPSAAESNDRSSHSANLHSWRGLRGDG